MYRMYGMPQGAREGGAAMSGCTACRKEPGMAVRLCQVGRYAVRSQVDGVYILMTYNLKPKTYNLQLPMMFNQ